MFDFYDDIYSGTLKRKVNILSFFQNTGLKIAKAIDKKFLLYLKNLFKDLKLKNESVMKFIKVYEKSNEPLKKSSLELNFQKSELAKVFERNFNQIQNINEILIDNSPKEGSNLEKEIEEFFKENQPKNKGWLFRKNHEIGTHGQNLFFCLINNNTHLISLNPKTLKKALNISSIQIHKCNFLESIPSEIAANKGKKTVLKINKDNEGTSKKSFFIMDLSTLKTYLVRSDESLAILSVINFYISKSKTTAMGQNPNSLIQIIERAEPYYSGIIEFACCKKSSLNIFHSDLKNYSFKSKFIEIKANKLLISQYSLKDSLNLLEYELKLQNSPQESTQGYLFSLEKKLLPNNIPDLAYEENNLKSMKESFVVFNTLYDNIQNNEFRQRTENSPQNDANIDNFQNKKISFNNHTSEPHFQDLEVIYEKDECPNVKKNKNTTIRKSFKDFLNKLTGKKKKKVILAADSEFKRKEWVFSLNYYQTIILKDLIKKKNDTVGIRHTVLHESFQIKSAKTGKNFFKSSLVEKNTKNPDFYDVFSQQIIPNENGKNEINDMERNKILKIKEIPLKTLKKTNKPIRNTPMFFTEPDGTRNLGKNISYFINII